MKKRTTLVVNKFGNEFSYDLEIMEEISAGKIEISRGSAFSFEKARVVARIKPLKIPKVEASLVCGFVQVMTRADVYYALPAAGKGMDIRRTLLATVKHPKCPCLDGGDQGVHSYYLPIEQGGVVSIGSAPLKGAEKRGVMMGFLLPEDLQHEDRAFLVLLQDSPKVPFTNSGQLDNSYDLNAFTTIKEEMSFEEIMEDEGIPVSGKATLTPQGLVNSKSETVFVTPLRYLKWRYEFVTWLCVKLVSDREVALAVQSGSPGNRVAQLKWQFAGSAKFDAAGQYVSSKLDSAPLIDFTVGTGVIQLPGGMPCNAYIDKNTIAIDSIGTKSYESTVDSRAQSG